MDVVYLEVLQVSYLPLAKPALVLNLQILRLHRKLNNFLWPLLCVTSEKLYTIPLGIPILIHSNDMRFNCLNPRNHCVYTIEKTDN